MNEPTSTPIPFVILHHTNISSPHFDLLIDLHGSDAPLPTWRFPTHPTTWQSSPPSATRVPDHRRLYLTYEGEISDNRGTVSRIATGTATLLHQTDDHLTLQLHFESTPITLTLPRNPPSP